jgi:hypothetical protein
LSAVMSDNSEKVGAACDFSSSILHIYGLIDSCLNLEQSRSNDKEHNC